MAVLKNFGAPIIKRTYKNYQLSSNNCTFT